MESREFFDNSSRQDQPKNQEVLKNSPEEIVRKAWQNNIELLTNRTDNLKEQTQHAIILNFLTYIQDHPDKALQWPPKRKDITSWFLQVTQTIEQSTPLNTQPHTTGEAESSNQEPSIHTILKASIPQEDLLKLIRPKNFFRVLLDEFFQQKEEQQQEKSIFPRPEGTAQASPLRTRTSIDIPSLLTILGYSTAAQAYALNALQQARETFARFSPKLLSETQIHVQFNPEAIPGGSYLGSTDDQHFIGVNLETIPSLKHLLGDAPNTNTELAVSVLEHELVHVAQAKILDPKNPTLFSPFTSIPGTTQDLLRVFRYATHKDIDELFLLNHINEQNIHHLDAHDHAFRLIAALLEGQAIIQQIRLLNLKISTATDTRQRSALEETKHYMLNNLRMAVTADQAEAIAMLTSDQKKLVREEIQEKKEARQYYIEGRRMYSKLYKEFGLDALDRFFQALDFNRISQMQATPELMQAFINDPRILPGLETVPIIQKSLQDRPSTVVLPNQ